MTKPSPRRMSRRTKRSNRVCRAESAGRVTYSLDQFTRTALDGTQIGISFSVGGGDIENVRLLKDGSLLVWGTCSAAQTGWFLSGFDITHNGGATDGFVAKFSLGGIAEWGTWVGGSGADRVLDAAIVYDSTRSEANSRLMIVGTTTSSGGFVNDTQGDVTGRRFGDSVRDGASDGFVVVLSRTEADPLYR